MGGDSLGRKMIYVEGGASGWGQSGRKMDSNNIYGGRGQWVGTVWAKDGLKQYMWREGQVGGDSLGRKMDSNNICGAKKNISINLSYQTNKNRNGDFKHTVVTLAKFNSKSH